MSFLEDLQAAEAAIARIIEHAGQPVSIEAFYRLVGDGILSYARELPGSEDDIDAAVEEIMRMAADEMDEPMRQELGAYIKKTLTTTMDLYKDRIDVTNLPEAIRKSRIAGELEERFTATVKNVNEELQEESKAVLRELFQDKISQSLLEKTLMEKIALTKQYARTEAQTMVSAYTQLSRDQLATEAGLDYFLYYGHLILRSRHFCRIHIDGVFTGGQVDQMDNGQLHPVRVYVGGYNCIHSLVPVDPRWDKSLKVRAGMKARRIAIDKKGQRFITVISSEAGYKRLGEQVKLSGEFRFANARSNDDGYLGTHASWDALFDKSRGNARKDLEIERDAAELLTEMGHVIVLDPREKTNFGGPVDFIMNGEPIELKTPRRPQWSSAVNRIRKEKKDGIHQSDAYMLNLREEFTVDEYAELLRQLKSWKSRNSGISIYILKAYKPSLEGL